MIGHTWQYCSLEDVYNSSPPYMYSLICDYSKYIRDFGYITISKFIKGWNCITWPSFDNLKPGCFVYTSQGVRCLVMKEPYKSDDGLYSYIEVISEENDGSFDMNKYFDTNKYNGIELVAGELYTEDVTHADYRTKKIKSKESEEKICPILITKTSQPQN